MNDSGTGTHPKDRPSRREIFIKEFAREMKWRLAVFPYFFLSVPALTLAIDLWGHPIRPIDAGDYAASFVSSALGTVLIYLARLWPFHRRS